MERVTDSDGREYKVFKDVAYHVDTPARVVHALTQARLAFRSPDPYRIRPYYGDAETGRDWGEVFDVTGYVGNSTGRIKIPILLHNARSVGGGSILDHCIVKIDHANKRDGGTIYFHPTYHVEGD